jgi:hypothetical protein
MELASLRRIVMGKYYNALLTPLVWVLFLATAVTFVGGLVFLAGDVLLTLLGVVNK